MIKVAIVEDKDSEAATLSAFLERFAQERNESFLPVRFTCPTDFLSRYDGFDVVFMDIEFPDDMDGLKASRKLREKDSSVTLIFVTSFGQFAVKGYEVEAFDFYVKPLSYVDFSLRLSRALKRIGKQKSDSVRIRTGGQVKILPVKEIKYVEVIKHNLIFHTLSGNLEASGSLAETEASLKDKYFVRCNNCYLVNLWFVKGVDGMNVNVDGEYLAVSRPRRKEFMSALNRYLGE